MAARCARIAGSATCVLNPLLEEPVMRNHVRAMTAIGLLSLSCPVVARAQAPAASAPTPPPSALSGNVSVGLGITSGNTDTATFNGSYEVKFDPKTRNVVKSNGLFLYGKTNGTLSTEQYGLLVRDEYLAQPPRVRLR